MTPHIRMRAVTLIASAALLLPAAAASAKPDTTPPDPRPSATQGPPEHSNAGGNDNSNGNGPPPHANLGNSQCAGPLSEATYSVDIAAITDFHGQLVATADSGGALGVSGVLETLRAENPETIFVANGDSVGGSAFESALLDDDPTLEFLNALDTFASNSGNHEFDQGWADYRDDIIPSTDFDWLGANIVGADALVPYTIFTTADGVDVAFVGTITPALDTLVSPAGIEGISVTNLYTATNQIAAQLSDGNADNGEAEIVIAMTHYGSSALAGGEFSGDVDAIIAGHSHQDTNTLYTTAAGTTIPLLQSVNAGTNVMHLALEYNPCVYANRLPVVVETAELIPTLDYVSAASPLVYQIVGDAKAAAADKGAETVGLVTADILRPVGGGRGAESTIGNFLANVALWHANRITGADIGVINPGGIRADFGYAPDGAITYREAFTVQPFGNTMATVTLTGAQIDTMLEQQFQDGADRPVLRLGISDNLSYVFDPTRPQFDRVTDVFIDGVAVDPAAEYVVSGNAFLLAGGDSFTVFTEGANYVDTGTIDVDALISWFVNNGQASPNLAQHSTGFALTVDGTTATANISSLAFTRGEIAPATVTLMVNGTEVGSAPVSIVPDGTTDLTGTATITFAVPAGVDLTTATFTIVTDDGTTNITF